MAKNFGVKNRFALHMRFPSKVELSEESWPLVFPYSFEAWDALNQVSTDSFIDLIGRCVKLRREVSSGLPKQVLTLVSEAHEQAVELLGDHTGVVINTGDVVA